ncbi:MAG TPA: hypothetical protein VHN39_02425, partial [Phenylobacterium sp.]|nr:hypothetical protein [Phenylobacterium sp.]
ADAQAQVDRASDPVLAAQALGYRALHLRNQGKFAEAAAAGRQALQARAQVRAARGMTVKGPALVATSAGEVSIGSDLAHALNSRSGGQDLMGSSPISVSDQLLVQDAQAWEVIGSSLQAEGDLAGARDALGQASRLLTASEANGALNVWLRSRVEADLADLDVANGQPGQAADRLATSIQILRARHAGTSTEGGLLLQLGHAQMLAGRDDAALASFGRAFSLFQSQRGSLGASADDAAPYFDLLLAKIASDPAKADDYRGRFFSAAESVVSNSTAQTVSKLAARVASGDGAITGLVRALDDTKRELRATEARVANLQATNTYLGEAKTTLDLQLKTLQQQSDTLEAQLLAANPRYAQLVASTAALPDLQKALRKDEVYLKLVLLGGRGYGIVVSQTAAKPYRLELSREQAASAVRAIRSPFEAEAGLPAFDIARSYALFQQLLGPVRTELASAKHLIYEPDGALISLPVAMLVTEDPAPLLAGLAAGKEPDYRKVAWLGARLD